MISLFCVRQKTFFLINAFCFLVLLQIGLSFGLSSCGSAPKEPVVVPEEPEVSSIPTNRDPRTLSFFWGISEEALNDVELGSPSSLRHALSLLRKSDMDLRENEKVLIYTALSIMQIVWVSERVDMELPVLSQETPYSGAIRSIKYGLYDTSTGKSDYLLTLLPSLVIATTDDVSPFFGEAKEDLLVCLKKHPDSVLVNYLLGLLYRKNSEFDKAQSYFNTALKGAPDNFQCCFSNAENLCKLGKYRDSFSITQSLLEKNPRNTQVLNLNARNAFNLKSYSVAEECVAKILQSNPNDLEALLFRIRILVEKKDYIHAASLLDVYSRQDSTSRDYLLLRARVQYDWSKNTAAAISTVESALRMYPEDQELQLFAARLANVSKTRVSGKSSEDIANDVLANDPANDIALQYAVEGLVQKGEWKKAYEQSSLIVSRGTAEAESVFLHIKICLAVGKNDEAWNMISPLYKSDPNDEQVVQAYIVVLQETGRSSQALNLINQLLPDSVSKMKSFLYYRRSLLKSREEEVLSDLRSSLIANPRNSDALFRLYEIYYKKKDFRKAQYYLKQVVALNPNDAKMRALNDDLTLKLESSR